MVARGGSGGGYATASGRVRNFIRAGWKRVLFAWNVPPNVPACYRRVTAASSCLIQNLDGGRARGAHSIYFDSTCLAQSPRVLFRRLIFLLLLLCSSSCPPAHFSSSCLLVSVYTPLWSRRPPAWILPLVVLLIAKKNDSLRSTTTTTTSSSSDFDL